MITDKHKALARAAWMLLLAFFCGFLILSVYSSIVANALVVCALVVCTVADAFAAGMWFARWRSMK